MDFRPCLLRGLGPFYSVVRPHYNTTGRGRLTPIADTGPKIRPRILGRRERPRPDLTPFHFGQSIKGEYGRHLNNTD